MIKIRKTCMPQINCWPSKIRARDLHASNVNCKGRFCLERAGSGLIFAGQQKLVASDDRTALVGAFRTDEGEMQDSGSAYVYTLDREGWRVEAKLVAGSPLEGDALGGNLALKNYTAVLGVIGRDDIVENAGAVLVFEHESGRWLEKQWLMAIDAKKSNSFGQGIALTDNTLVIGAPRSDALAVDSGSAYVYQRKNNQWQFQAKLTASYGAEGYLYDFVYDGTQWYQQVKLMAEDGGDDDQFGRGVSLEGNTAIISAMHNDEKEDNAGVLYVYKKIAGDWVYSSKILVVDGMAGDRLGWNVALSEGHATIASPN